MHSSWGGSPEDEQISAESWKYERAKNNVDRDKSLKRIRKCGGDRKGFVTTYPAGNEVKDKASVISAFRKKVEKADKYLEKFESLGLVIALDIPLFLYTDYEEWGKWLLDYNDGKYDFVILKYWSGFDMYDFRTKQYVHKTVDREHMDALKKLSRMIAEGIISPDDPLWN